MLTIHITGDRGEGSTTVSALVEKALADAGYAMRVTELWHDGQPAPLRYQRHLAKARARIDPVHLEPGRNITINVQSMESPEQLAEAERRLAERRKSDGPITVRVDTDRLDNPDVVAGSFRAAMQRLDDDEAAGRLPGE